MRMGRPVADRFMPTKHPTTLDIYYAAGFYEGEGTIRHPKGTLNGIYITVGQKRPWILYRLRDLFGGSVFRDEQRERPIYLWSLHGSLARGFIMTIYSLLSPYRRLQAAVALHPDLFEDAPSNP